MPLWTTATSSPDVCGCALTGVGAPCVAQRVCEMPVVPTSCALGLRREVGDARGAERARCSAGARAAVDDREAGRVVAAIFEPPDAVDQDGNDVAREAAPTMPHMMVLSPCRRVSVSSRGPLPAGDRHLPRAREGELARAARPA